MQRETWKFDYTAGKLAEAAQSKIAYHQGHLNLWKAKREELLVTIRSEGNERKSQLTIAMLTPSVFSSRRVACSGS